MEPQVYWVANPGRGRLGIMARPRGDDWLAEEVQSLRHVGVDIVVSMLTSGEVVELGLTQEAEVCKANGVTFHSLPIPDREVPSSMGDVRILIQDLHDELGDGRNVVIHCRAGIGRSTVVAAGVLVLAGSSASDALALISEARGRPVPDTEEQSSWVERFETFYRNGEGTFL